MAEVQGLPYGENKALNDAMRATPDLRGQSPGGGEGNPQPQLEVQRPDVFGPSQRPAEAITTGVPDQNLLPDDPVAFIRALYVRYPNEDLRRLLERAAEDMAGR